MKRLQRIADEIKEVEQKNQVPTLQKKLQEFEEEFLKKENEEHEKKDDNNEKREEKKDERKDLRKDEKKDIRKDEKKDEEEHDEKGGFSLALDTRLRIKNFKLKSCNVLDSKKKPLWLNMVNCQAKNQAVLCIYKTGDDLRQDLLTIQLIKIMDKIWLEGGFDFRMKPYKVFLIFFFF